MPYSATQNDVNKQAIIIIPSGKTVAIHKAAIIPIHLKAQVKRDLDRDVL